MIPSHKSNESTTYDSCHSRATRGVDILNKVGVYSGKNWSKLETFVYIAQSVYVNIGNLLQRTCLLRIHYATTWQHENIEMTTTYACGISRTSVLTPRAR